MRYLVMNLSKLNWRQRRNFPDAFFAASDSLAIGALKAFQEAGLIVPDQIQIISFNDTIMAKQDFLPYLVSLSTLKKWGELPWTSSISNVLSPREIPTLTMLGTKLTLRGSTKEKTIQLPTNP